jgi:signal transduction histidine kinase
MLLEMLRDFRELIEMKGLNLQTEIAQEVYVKANAALMELMLGNLLKNAINHNIPEKGEIRIKLNQDKLVMENTGLPLKGKPEQAFNRFYKESKNLNSLGLGLSIVKKIIEVNHFRIDYFNHDTHRLEITFPGKSSDLLQNSYQVSSE